MDLFANIRKMNDNFYLFSMDTDIDTVILAQPFGYLSDRKEEHNGYAHLLEHMTIKANNEYLNSLEKRGLIFNAETQESQTCYMFLDLTGRIAIKELEKGAFGEIHTIKFTEEQLEIERKTITEEHSLLSNIHGKQVADLMIGTVEQISAFDLNTLLKIRKMHYTELTCLVMGNPYHFPGELSSMHYSYNDIDIDWFRHVGIEKISYEDEVPVMEFAVTPYSELLVYFLRVLFPPSADASVRLKISREDDKLRIVLLGDGDGLKSTLSNNGKYKENSYYRYYINLSNSKFLQSELIYILNQLSPLMDITRLDFTQLYFNTLWEEALYEKLIVLQS